MNSTELENLFKSDKTDWYSENPNGSKNWDLSKLNHFWNMIKTHKILKNDFEFDGFVFPTFYKTNSFWLNTNDIYFDEIFGAIGKLVQCKVRFINCTFQGAFLFNNFNDPNPNIPKSFINFKKSLEFVNCIFNGEFRLISVNIHENLAIHECEFNGEIFISENNVLKNLSIYNCFFYNNFSLQVNRINKINLAVNTFDSLTGFSKNYYSDIFSLNSCTFNYKTIFIENTYKKYFTLASNSFNDTATFKNESFLYGNFQDLTFSDKNSSMNEISIRDSKILKLTNIYFPPNFSFVRCDCMNILFKESSIENAKFDSCEWNISNRLIIKDETDLDTITISSFLKLENIYRQLKKNFDNQKDWELSGYAYISEMEMRKKRLFLENKYGSSFIYWFYGFFGGYTQNFLRPILSFLILTLICSIFYFFIDFDLINALERGAKGAFPYIEIREEEPYPKYWLLLKNVQLILSGVFLSFFILALRKRFKQ